MSILNILKISWNGLKTNRSRSILTILGIVIGITAIIFVMAVGNGAQGLILSQVQGIGSKTIAVIPGREPTGPSDSAQIMSDSLKERDVELLKRKENAPYITEIMPVVFGGETGSYGNETYRLTVFGATELISEIFDLNTDQGTFFNSEDVKTKDDVVVIGAKVKEELFGGSDAIGQKIKIKDRNFRVIGTLPKKGQASLFNFDEMVVVPYTTAQQYIFGIKYFHRIIIEAESEDKINQTVRDIENTLRFSHKISDPSKDDFAVQTQVDLVERLGLITNIMTILLASIASISLIVGGIGIMNITLVSVSERTQEIGLRKAVGATNKDILNQFLYEAVLLTFIGGAIGIFLGLSMSFATSLVLSKYLNLDWTFSFPFGAIFLGFGVSALIGLVFGIYPARKASLKNPIDSLRHE